MLTERLARVRAAIAGFVYGLTGYEFARHALSHRAQSEFGRRKCRKSLAAANAGGGSGKEDRAVPAWNHHASGFAADQESGVARQFPSPEEQLFGGVQ